MNHIINYKMAFQKEKSQKVHVHVLSQTLHLHNITFKYVVYDKAVEIFACDGV